jgi:hypothetical protein
MEATLKDHEQRLRDAEKALSSGDTRFMKIEGQLSNVSDKLGELNDTIKSAIRWALTMAGGAAVSAILWAIAQSGGKGAP